MKTHFAEENDDVTSCNDTAEDHCWREHRLPNSHLAGNISIAVALLIGLIASNWLWSPAPAPHDMIAIQARQPQPSFVVHGSPQRLIREADAAADP
jgi:hypothetical protein